MKYDDYYIVNSRIGLITSGSSLLRALEIVMVRVMFQNLSLDGDNGNNGYTSPRFTSH